MQTTHTSTKQELLEKQKQYLWPNHLLYYTEPLPLERGEGLRVWDVEGKEYLDFFGGILTTSVGHNRPEIVEAVKNQTEKMIHSSTLYPNEAHVNLAEKMAQITPGKLQVSFFTPSGTDADETAVFLAKKTAVSSASVPEGVKKETCNLPGVICAIFSAKLTWASFG